MSAVPNGTYDILAESASGVAVFGPPLSVTRGHDPPLNATSIDEDGNGIPDSAEVQLARMFSPTLIFHDEDTPGMQPCPTGVMAWPSPQDSSTLYASQLYARVYNLGQLAGTAPVSDPGWSPPLTANNPAFIYADRGWDSASNPIGYIGNNTPFGIDCFPGPCFYYLFVDLGGPPIHCRADWADYYDENVRGVVTPTVYAHLFLDGAKTIIQYWFFYPFNDFLNKHEGDWEHINVMLSSSEPTTAIAERVNFYFHTHYQNRPAELVRFVDDTHPLVWVGGKSDWTCGFCSQDACATFTGAGSHASYPSPYEDWQNIELRTQGYPCGTNARPDENVPTCGRRLHWGDYRIEIMRGSLTVDYTDQPGLSWLKPHFPWGTPFVPSPCDGVNPLQSCDVDFSNPNHPIWADPWEDSNCPNRAPTGPQRQGSWFGFTTGANAYSGPTYPDPNFPLRTFNVPGGVTLADAIDCVYPGEQIVLASGTYNFTSGLELPSGTRLLSAGDAQGTTLDNTINATIHAAVGARDVYIGSPDSGFTISGGYPQVNLRHGEVAGNRFIPEAFLGSSITITDTDNVAWVTPCTLSVRGNRFEGSIVAIDAVQGVTPQDVLSIGDDPNAPNDFISSSPMLSVNSRYDDPCPLVRAGWNYWGTTDIETIQNGVTGDCSGSVVFSPWYDVTHTTLYYGGTGVEPANAIPSTFSVTLRGPNPIRGSAQLAISVPDPGGTVAVSLYDVSGRRVIGTRAEQRAGLYEVAVDVRQLSAGIYFAHVRYRDRRSPIRLVVVR